MKRFFLVFAALFVFTSVLKSQNIPFTNTFRILDLDTGSVMNFYKVPLPQAGYKNFYVQRGGIAYPPYDYDMRIGNMYRYVYTGYGFSDSVHNRRFHNSWSFSYYGYHLGYVLNLAFSAQDTNLFVYAYQGANWEPADYTTMSYDNGINLINFLPNSLMNQCGGMAIDPVNDSIIYVGYNAQLVIGNVYKTTNRGANWFCIDTIASGIYGTKFFINNFNRNTIFISRYSDLFRSTTGGTDFQVIKTGLSNVRMYFDASDNTIYMSSANSEGLLKSTNNGSNWTTLLNKAVNDFEFDPLNGNIIYAGCTDGLYRSVNKGNTWTLYNNSFMPDINVKGIVKNPNTADTLFVSTNKAVYKVFGPSVLDTAISNYLPLSVGNLYVYSYYVNMPPATYRYKIRITKDTVVAGKRFFYCSQVFPGFNANENWIRMDGVTGVISSLSNTSCNYLINEKYIDSLKSKKSDTLYKCNPYTKSICIDTTNLNVFGYPSRQKVFKQDGLVLNYRTYSKNFGLIISEFWEMDDIVHYLVGCKINGITYGDTLLTGVESISNEVPEMYSLSQNYPNPFNPVTKIKFSVPQVRHLFGGSSAHSPGGDLVLLKVFDITGREIQTLVNETLQPGTYEISFDGSGLTSGVYFYKIQSGNFIETKKMLMIK